MPENRSLSLKKKKLSKNFLVDKSGMKQGENEWKLAYRKYALPALEHLW